ncbi:MAG: TIGR03936 family radical SAM-associated protein, partial [Rhodospirillaceae bacterium]|nr:TIGR03936 family radical SAM-associated protein [Rhodospirillaceae bacterium]
QGDPVVYRARFDKFGPMALRGHGELIRILPRVLRRAGLPIRFSEGFSPRPKLSFGPALPLGVQSLDEYCEFALTAELAEGQVLEALRGAAEEGLRFTGLDRTRPGEPRLSRWIAAVRYAVLLAADLEPAELESRLEAFRSAGSWPLALTRRVKAKSRRRGTRPSAPREREVEVDLRDFVEDVRLAPAGVVAPFLGCSADRLTLRFRMLLSGTGSLPRPVEITRALAGFEPVAIEIVRTACEPAARGGGSEMRLPPAEASLTGPG